MMSPFQGAHSTPHSWVMAKALVYWLTEVRGKQRGEMQNEYEFGLDGDERREWKSKLESKEKVLNHIG